MKLHEFQAKQVLKRFGVAVPDGREAQSVEAAVAAYRELKSPVAVVKAQIHAGGRGKAGGVKIVQRAVRAAAGAILGKTLVTHQTGPDGQPCGGCGSGGRDRRYYLGIAIDRERQLPVLM